MEDEEDVESPGMSHMEMDSNPPLKIDIHRDVLTQEALIQKSDYAPYVEKLSDKWQARYASWTLLGFIVNLIPILGWLPSYSIRKYFLRDVIAGFTVGIICISHGLAYGLLAGVAPSNGLYVGIVQPLVYVLLGTSRHVSIGTFSVISIMTYKVVQEHATEDLQPGEKGYTALQVATATAIMAGIVHISMAVLSIGSFTALMSDPLLNGFTSAAAMYAVTAQLKEATGIDTPPHRGLFQNVVTLSYLVKLHSQANMVAISMCLLVMVFMVVMNECIKPWSSKHYHVPVPAELIAIIFGTIASNQLSLENEYGVDVVGTIPLGLPDFDVPPMELLPLVIVDAIAIAIVSYTVTMSMGIMFAQKYSYKIRPNQELFALGVSNIVGGYFSCYPLSCSLARSLVQAAVGGATQIATVVAACVVLSTILWLGIYLKSLPKCVLSAVIIVALKPMFIQLKYVRIFMREGKLAFITWFITFFIVLLIDIAMGLFAGMIVSAITFYIHGAKPYHALLGTFSGGDGIYVNIFQHLNSSEVNETKIFRFTGSLNFATKSCYQKSLYEAINVDRVAMQRVAKSKSPEIIWTSFRILVLDFSSLAYLDIEGCEQLNEIKQDMTRLGVRLLLANPSDNVYDMIVQCQKLELGPFDVFATVHDAVEYGNACMTGRFSTFWH